MRNENEDGKKFQNEPNGDSCGRGRDGASNTEPENNPANFMTVLENMAAAMQATVAALGNQAGNRNGSDGEKVPMTLATFLKVNPPIFREMTDPTEVDSWFQVMEWALHAQQVPENQRVEFVTYQLMGEAQHWWQRTRRLLQQDDIAIPWNAFQLEFYKKYFPNSVSTAKELELLQLKQGQMSVAEYTNKFEELCRFFKIFQGAPGDFEEWKCIKYEGGLRSDILSSVGPMKIRVFSDLVNKSRVAEECLKKAAIERNDGREFHRKEHNQNFAPRGQEFKRKGKQLATTSDDSSCQKCRSYHPNRPCRFGSGLCYKCNRLGHMS
ncbi:uncharacterized protein LOC107470569 [Arachis duranensis]|uniref:Uncharacterized protein LOC107470569 n=1 Tax=Arachis duranensis TaxID=130453 RepID=A0A6P4BP24_ARADU|nr:uncharacterized protein LOC107470569 [Arachis duranensis]